MPNTVDLRRQVEALIINGLDSPIPVEVISELEGGRQRSVNLGSDKISVNSQLLTYALIGIKLQAAHAEKLVAIIGGSIFANTVDNQLVQLFEDPTVAGTFTFADHPDSIVQIAIANTNGSNTVTLGTLLTGGYVQSQVSSSPTLLGSTVLEGDPVIKEYVLTTKTLSNNAQVLAALIWREFIE